jgi:hypothetical protein
MDDLVSVVNQALIRLGADTIVTMDSPSSKRAKLAVMSVTTARDECLQKNHWCFAIKRESLAPLTETPAFEWAYMYQLPSDYLGIIKSYPANLSFAIEGDVLLTNEATFCLRYTRKVEDIPKMPPLFKRAWALHLAGILCTSLTASVQSLPREIKKEFEQVIDEAIYLNAIETVTDEGEQHDGDWEASRYI